MDNNHINSLNSLRVSLSPNLLRNKRKIEGGQKREEK